MKALFLFLLTSASTFLFSSCVFKDAFESMMEILTWQEANWTIVNTTDSRLFVKTMDIDITNNDVAIQPSGMLPLMPDSTFDLASVSQNLMLEKIVWSDIYKLLDDKNIVYVNVFSEDAVLLKTWRIDQTDVGTHNLFDESQWRFDDLEYSKYPIASPILKLNWYFEIRPEDLR